MADLTSHVRVRRERARLRAVDLARLVGVTRQALHSIETGAYVPNTLIALQLARHLGCTVEELFALNEPEVMAQLVGSAALPARVRLAQVGADWLAFPTTGMGEAADGLVKAQADGRARVTLFGDLEAARQTAVVVGCDPSLGLLATHVARQATAQAPARMLWRSASSLDALRGLARGEAHAAGIHLWDAGSGVSNLPFVQRELPGRGAQLFTLWSWEQGLMVRVGNPKGLAGAADLLRPDVQLVNREEGAGSRVLLDAWLDTLGVSWGARRTIPGYLDEVLSPLAAAERVASGQADAAPGPRSAALALGLPFIPLQTERFDLVVPDEFVAHPGLAALLTVVGQSAFRTELQALGGYDPAHAGERWRSTA